MRKDMKRDADKLDAGQQQTEASTEANKPDDARAKDEPKAGNILGGMQPD